MASLTTTYPAPPKKGSSFTWTTGSRFSYTYTGTVVCFVPRGEVAAGKAPKAAAEFVSLDLTSNRDRVLVKMEDGSYRYANCRVAKPAVKAV